MTPAPEFLQSLLGAECQPAKAWRIIEEGLHTRESLLACEWLTDTERRRARDVSLTIPAEGVFLAPERFPGLLTDAPAIPPALGFVGDPDVLETRFIAIVGTRNASTYGRAVARKFAGAFAKAGLTVISGGALGIDAAAHKGALAVEGRTMAVLATGAEGAYPFAHEGLFREIRRRGGTISSYAFGAKPADYKFLQRNGLIAAIAEAVLVVESPLKSGSLSTATQAAEMGREVFVVPAAIDQTSFLGSFALLRDGASLAIHPDDVLATLGVEPRPEEPSPASDHATESPSGKLVAALGEGPCLPEALVERTGLAAPDVLAELTMLELDGTVVRDGGKYALAP